MVLSKRIYDMIDLFAKIVSPDLMHSPKMIPE